MMGVEQGLCQLFESRVGGWSSHVSPYHVMFPHSLVPVKGSVRVDDRNPKRVFFRGEGALPDF